MLALGSFLLTFHLLLSLRQAGSHAHHTVMSQKRRKVQNSEPAFSQHLHCSLPRAFSASLSSFPHVLFFGFPQHHFFWFSPYVPDLSAVFLFNDGSSHIGFCVSPFSVAVTKKPRLACLYRIKFISVYSSKGWKFKIE